MHRYYPLSLLLLALPLQAAHAQEKVRVGLFGGLNTSRGKLSDPEATTYDQRQNGGVAVGLLVDVPFGKLAVQPAFRFAQKGFGAELTYRTVRPGDSGGTLAKTRLTQVRQLWNYLEIPVNVVYTTGTATKGFQVFGGPFCAMLLSGKQTGSVEETTVFTDSFGGYRRVESSSLAGSLKARNDVTIEDIRSGSAANYLRPWDVGLQLGAGYSFGRLGLRLTQSWGLRNLVPTELGEAQKKTLRSKSLEFGLLYMLGTR